MCPDRESTKPPVPTNGLKNPKMAAKHLTKQEDLCVAQSIRFEGLRSQVDERCPIAAHYFF
jgi:hypothetical protein